MTTWSNEYTMAVNASVEQLRGMIDAKMIGANEANSEGETLLHQMSVSGKVDNIRLLIEKGADVSAKDNYGETPLVSAIKSNQFIASIVLAKAQEDINSIIFDGKTALHIAAEAGCSASAFALIKAGADVKVKNKDGKDALQVAMQKYEEESPKVYYFHSATRNMVELLGLAMKREL